MNKKKGNKRDKKRVIKRGRRWAKGRGEKKKKNNAVFQDGKKRGEKENSSVRNCTLIKAVSSEIPFFEGSRLLNKLFRVKSLFALPWIIHGFVSSWYLHSREDSRGWDTI